MRFLSIASVLVLAACGTSLDSPMDNLVGCFQLHEALSSKCPYNKNDEASYQFLNCDKMPGCPSGKVEADDVASCREAIEATGTCAQAQVVTCAIKKEGCTAPVDDTYGTLAGWERACDTMIASLLEHPAGSCVITSNDCENLLGCRETKTGAYAGPDIEAALTAAREAADCAAAQSAIRAATIRSKFCLDLAVSI